VFLKLRKLLKMNIQVIICAARVVHSGVQMMSAEMLPIDIETTVTIFIFTLFGLRN
jgi:hypothetical protein